MVTTANLFHNHGHSVTLVILDETTTSFYPILPGIQIIQQPLSFGITSEGNIFSRKMKLLSDVLQLRRIIKTIKADTIIATEYPFAIAAKLTGAGKKSKLFAWEHHHLYELQKNFFWEKIFNLTYPRLDAVVTLNADEKQFFTSINANPVIIPNFITPVANRATLTNKIILTVARLTSVKGIDILLQAAKNILQKHTDWQWKIIGGGDLGEEVVEFIRNNHLQNRLIVQRPVSHRIQIEYENASIYVMTSRYECLPMTLLEAQSSGLPCIAFDCETGPRHIITNNEDGFLIEKENLEKLEAAISSLITKEELRKNMGAKAFQNVQRFSPEAIYNLWKQIL